MKRFAVVLGFLVGVLVLSAPSMASTWKFNKPHTSIQFNVKHMMVTDVWGRFHDFDGTLTYDPDHPLNTKVSVTIQANSIDTDNDYRNKDLRSDRFFDVEKYPTITFTSTKVVKTVSGFDLTGDLTMHGVTKPMTLHVTGPTPPFQAGKHRKIAVNAQGTIDRTQWNLTWNKTLETGGVLVGDDVNLVINCEMDETD